VWVDRFQPEAVDREGPVLGWPDGLDGAGGRERFSAYVDRGDRARSQRTSFGQDVQSTYADGARVQTRFGVDAGLFASAPGFTDSGKWRVEDGKLCGSLRKIGEFCNEARFDAGTLFLRRMSGEVIRYVPN